MRLVVDNNNPVVGMENREYTLDERISQIVDAINKRMPENEFDAIWGSIVTETTEHHTWNSDQVEAFANIIDAAKTLVLEQKEVDG